MGRVYGKGKGVSKSALPYKRTPPTWQMKTAEEVEQLCCKLARKGLNPSQIGVILRDQHGVSQVRSICGQQIMRLLKKNGLGPEIPEDLYYLIKKAVSMRKHLERNRSDKSTKYYLILLESRIHRLSRYYKKTKHLPPTWRYESSTASALVA